MLPDTNPTLADLEEERRNSKSAGLQVVCVADIEAKPIDWLWDQKIARGKLTLISGDPGLGKSLITVALASAVSRGARWPVTCGHAPEGSVVMLSDEDAIADTIRPRLDAAGADCSKVHVLQMIRERDEDGCIVKRTFSLAKDIDSLAQVVHSLHDCVLVTIDPVSAYLGGVDSHKNADVRALLSPLADMAEDLDVAVVAVTHLNKGSGRAMYRSVGSIAFTASARTAWAVTKDKNDSSRRLVLPVKNNLGNDRTGMAYRIESSDGAPVLLWESAPVDDDVDEALCMDSEGFRSEREDAANWLRIELNGNPMPPNTVRKASAAAGHSWATIRRAKDELRIESRKCGFKGGWLWYLPDDLPEKDEKALTNHEDAHYQDVSTFEDSEEVEI